MAKSILPARHSPSFMREPNIAERCISGNCIIQFSGDSVYERLAIRYCL